MVFSGVKTKFSLSPRESEELLPHYNEDEKSHVNVSIWDIIKHYSKKLFVYILFGLIIIVLLYNYSLKNKSQLLDISEIEKLDKIISKYYKNSTIPEIEDHLIIVAGHSIGKSIKKISSRPDDWNIKSFQTKEIKTFLTHIATGILIAKYNKKGTLIFTGGQTQESAGPFTEGQSYWYVANIMKWLDNDDIRKRSTTEEFARDSYENLIFSICRYHEFTSKYPKYITLISYPYKHYRFFNLHREALKYPKNKFQFVGINHDLIDTDKPSDLFPESISEMPDDLPSFEVEHSINNFKEDPYGCKGVLLEKKIDRNPFKRNNPYSKSCPELKEILEYCKTNEIINEIQWDEI